MGRSISNEELIETIKALDAHGTQAKAADALGITQGSLSIRMKRASQRGLLGYKPVLPGFEVKSVTSGPAGDSIQQVPEAGPEFELPEGHIVKGVSSLLDAEGRVKQTWVKTKTDDVIPDLVAALKKIFDEYDGIAVPTKKPQLIDEDLLSVYPIADQHNGLLAWGEETGEDYDLKIGAARLRACMERLVSQSPRSKTAIILNLGDWQHTDDAKNQTPGHHNILDVDSRYFKILTAGVQLMMDCIEMAKMKHEQIIVRNIPGNHDPHASIALTVALSAFYSKDPRVIIDDDPSDFFYHRFGNTLIGATHGHKMKPDKMAMHMAVTRAEDWGQTQFRHYYFGHIHHETAKEVGNVRVESFQTIAAKDAYAHSHGYCSGQSLTSITHHKTDGEIGRHRVNLGKPRVP